MNNIYRCSIIILLSMYYKIVTQLCFYQRNNYKQIKYIMFCDIDKLVCLCKSTTEMKLHAYVSAACKSKDPTTCTASMCGTLVIVSKTLKQMFAFLIFLELRYQCCFLFLQTFSNHPSHFIPGHVPHTMPAHQ